MYIIIGEEAVSALNKNYIILDLEKMPINDSYIRAFCVVDSESIPFAEVAELDNNVKLHKTMMEQFELKNYQFCLQALDHLKHKFGGELDSFYEILRDKINDSN